MIAAWMAYCIGVSALLGLSAHPFERIAKWLGWPLRWMWLAALAGSLTLAAVPWITRPTTPIFREAASLAVAEARAEAVEVPSSGSPSAEPGSPAPPSFHSQSLNRALPFLCSLASALSLLILWAVRRKLLYRSLKWRWAMVDGVAARVSDDVGPAVMGFVDPMIVLPAWVLGMDPASRRLVLAHETEHLRGGDSCLLAAALLAIVLMPWNVGLWWQFRRLRDAIEMDCDARVLRRNPDVRGYAELLLRIGGRATAASVGLAGLAESKSLLERRIRSMVRTDGPRRRLPMSVLAAVAAALVLLACVTPVPTMPTRSVQANAPVDVVRHVIRATKPSCCCSITGPNSDRAVTAALRDGNG